jgi:hypothetical protein
MSKPGRNDPCPCGSGKKYKRCCLPSDEAAARERAQRTLFADDPMFGDSDFDEDDDPEELFEIDEDIPNGTDRSVEPRDRPTTVPVIRRGKVSRPAPAFDLSGVLKEHRRQAGECALCGKAIGRVAAKKHVAECAPAHDAPNGTEQWLVQLRATSPGLPAYWLDVEVKADATLAALDSFLRRVWLECCGHLSAFRIGAIDYFSPGYDFGFARDVAVLRGRRIAERRMSAKLYDALPTIGARFLYEYDFGSTTSLELKVIGGRDGRLGRTATRLLARNTPPRWPCAICGQPADAVCAFCFQGEATNPFVCANHERHHACGEDEGFLPVVNSPRMGVCGYAGEV